MPSRRDGPDLLFTQRPLTKCARHGFAAVYLGEREDLARMHARVGALGLQSCVVGGSAWREGQKLRQQPLLARALALREQLPRVVGIFDVLMAIEAAPVTRSSRTGCSDDGTPARATA